MHQKRAFLWLGFLTLLVSCENPQASDPSQTVTPTLVDTPVIPIEVMPDFPGGEDSEKTHSGLSNVNISDGSIFIFVNKTDEPIVFKRQSSSGFGFIPDSFTIPPYKKTPEMRFEGKCFPMAPGNNASISWSLAYQSHLQSPQNFVLQVINRGSLYCAKRLFSVNGQFRKIELTPLNLTEKSSPTPYFRFTAIKSEVSQNEFILSQEGPQANAF